MKTLRPCHCLIVVMATVVFTLNFIPPAAAQETAGNGALAFSFSGQFIVTGSAAKSPLLTLPAVITNSSLVHLEPAILSISAERIKQSLYHLLGIPSARDWQGNIYLALHPALWTDEEVTVVSRPTDRDWNYSVQLPDVVAADRYLRGMTGVLLLEFANRRPAVNGRCAEIPDWLIDGLSRQMQQDELSDVLLSSPDQPLDHLYPVRASHDKNLDPLAGVRQVLRKNRALTFAELSWPSEAQLAGEDGGVYRASAQLLVAELLKLNDGPAQFRQMLAGLSQCYNWQTAFQQAFHGHFARPLDLEKWWALTTVEFLSRDPGPSWTPAFSAGLLNELLTVPVEVRVSSNSLPSHVTLPLQAVVRKFTLDRQSAIFRAHLQDLRLAELRMAPQFVALTDSYCRALAAYLGERLGPAPRVSRSAHHTSTQPVRLNARGLVKQLDVLDARRRTLEAAVPLNVARNF
jgi:hypothetical protein